VDISDVSLFGRELERWWTFNIADNAITCAIIVLLIRIFFVRQYPSVEPAEAPETSPARCLIERCHRRFRGDHGQA